MTDETKNEIRAVLTLLKNTLVRNGVSIALAGSDDTGKDDGCICFFDTAEYCRTNYRHIPVCKREMLTTFRRIDNQRILSSSFTGS